MTDSREALREMIVRLAIRRGPIALSNGGVSLYYFDCKRLTLDSEGAAAVGHAIVDVISQLVPPPVAIGGLTLGADPMIGAAMLCARERGLKLHGFYVRKEPKKHGTRNFIENEPARGDRVVIVDDVVTTGQSTIIAIDRAEEIGCDIVAVVAIVDRMEGGADRIRKRVPGARFSPLFDLTDFPEIETIKREMENQAAAGNASAG